MGSELLEKVRAALERTPNTMTLQLSRNFQAPEADVVRCLPEGWATELDVTRWEPLIRKLADLGEMHVIVTNGAATLESVGRFGGFSTWDEFFNVQTKTLDMHIRWPNLGSAFAVAKPSHMTGLKTLSVQFFDKEGQAAFKAFLSFGATEPKPEVLSHFEAIRSEFGLPG